MKTTLPVLMYHEITRETSSDVYAITESKFREHIEYIASKGYTGCSISELDRAGNHGKPVGITFDDGYKSDSGIAMPVLKEYGFSATFFISTGLVGTKENMQTWEGLEELVSSGMDVQVHGHRHIFLDALPEAGLREELEYPKTLLQERYGCAIEHLSLPGGRYSRKTLEMARQLGYRTVSTSVPGANAWKGSSLPYLVKRNVVHQNNSGELFRKTVDRDEAYYVRERAKYESKRLLKKMIGNGTYQKAWSWLMK